MKTYINNMPLLFSLVLIAGVFITSCNKEDSPSGGVPKIDYIRLTDPEKADSFITTAFMGQLIAIVGEDLGGAREIWFNDRQGILNPSFTTDNCIIANVTRELPENRTDIMKLVFEDGFELQYDFLVDIPPPEISSIVCEYVPDGETVILIGDYFFEPLTVLFPGDLEAEVVNAQKTRLEVTVPVGSSSGQISVENVIGYAISPFLFRDDRNTIVNFDDLLHEDWTAAIAYADSTPEIDPISGNYAIVQSNDVAEWSWENNLAIFAWGENVRGDVPLATGIVADLDFRFEINVPIPWYDVRMEIYFSPYGEGHGRDAVDPSFARWKPWLTEPYTTSGWVTVSIPLVDFNFDHDDANDAEVGSQPLTNLTGLTNLNMMIFGPQESDPNTTHPVQLCIDNIRIVPNTVE